MTHAHDKHGTPIEKGDEVHTVYGGEHHAIIVERTDEDAHGRPHIIGKTAVRVPAATTHVVKKADKKGHKA
ncbi:MAG TPA: hypothetical protein VFB58_13715 [Chloroflexota bacterium]|nr:hypothetical protein [Chloroflexota bacterium]